MVCKPHYDGIIESPIGKLGIVLCASQLATINLLSDTVNLITPLNLEAEKICAQLNDYFTDPHYIFQVNFLSFGTSFQKKVWERLKKIPTGKILTYGQLAEQLNTSPRAIGQACRTNPWPIVIPCHRIVGKNQIGGYFGACDGKWLQIKKWLLAHEGVVIKG